MPIEPTPPSGGFDDRHDRDRATPAGEAAWGEWVYSHDRSVRCTLTRSTHDELYLFAQANPEFIGIYGIAPEPKVMLWVEVASWSDQASTYDLMSPEEAVDYAEFQARDDDDEDDEDDEDDDGDGDVGEGDDQIRTELSGAKAEPHPSWTPPAYVSFGGDQPDHMTHLKPDEVDGPRRYNLLAHLVWRFSAESANGLFNAKAVFADVPWVGFTPNHWDERTTFYVRRSPGPFEVPPEPGEAT